ncbi:MAG TPA: DHHA1 domain-containing protein, partial [Candidatus Saccharimonadales bacterium]|nr:DHHA1 domain-containing protein [Candidatus Saccharimonadales bacterium]
CAVDMPTYLRYLPGWDRVSPELPREFDASIIVDASTMTLFEHLGQADQKRLTGKPCVVLDHHETVENLVPFATVMINDPGRASAGERLYLLAKELGWPLSAESGEFICASILGDTQGLTNQLASAETYRIMAELVDLGVDRPKLEEMRREYGKMQPEIFRYKAELIGRTEFALDGRLAYVSVPQNEINQYSPLYNPAPLIQNDMLQTTGVEVAIVFKVYDDGKITGAIRCAPSAPIGADLAEHLGGGGHKFASGFKVSGGRSFEDVRQDCLRQAEKLLSERADT